MSRWVFPLDPECTEVDNYRSTLIDDPMTAGYGAPIDDILNGWENTHRRNCKKCQEYGAANVDVE